MDIFFKLILLLFSIDLIPCYPIETPAAAVGYLERYGYVNGRRKGRMDSSRALKMFQHMTHIQETGVLDMMTIKKMNAKRCGNPDLKVENVTEEISSRSKRFETNVERRTWNKPQVTYKVTRYPRTGLHPHVINGLISRAFDMWQYAFLGSISFINITQLFASVDIEIRFVKGDHGDDYPLDGPGQTLAHAFPPGDGLFGDIHIDETEDWDVTGERDGSNIFWVIIHEIGHSLGLSHSMVKSSIMEAIEPVHNPNMKLHADDIEGIRSLYKLSESSPQIPETTTPSTTITFTESAPKLGDEPTAKYYEKQCKARPKPCSNDFRVDAATVLQNGNIYLFSGCYAIQVTRKSHELHVDGVHRIQHHFKGLMDNLDAAVTTNMGYTYFYAGNKMMRYFNYQSAPEQTESPFSRGPKLIDSAFHWKNSTYVIMGNEFHEVKSRYRGPLGYISNWGVTDEKVDAAFVIRHRVYLISGDRYWVLFERSDGSFQVRVK